MRERERKLYVGSGPITHFLSLKASRKRRGDRGKRRGARGKRRKERNRRVGTGEGKTKEVKVSRGRGEWRGKSDATGGK